MNATPNDPRLARVLAHDWTTRAIENTVGNWTQNREVMSPATLASLQGYARRVAVKVLGGMLPYPDFSPDWRRTVSDAVWDVLGGERFLDTEVPIIANEVRTEFYDTSTWFIGRKLRYSLAVIANEVACLTYMIASNLEPELLREYSEEEKKENRERNLGTLRRLIKDPPCNVHITVLDLSGDDTFQDVVNEIILHVKPPDVSEVFKKK